MKKIDVSTVEGCMAFLESKGTTIDEVKQYKKTHSAKELARFLHTSPNVVSGLMRTLGLNCKGIVSKWALNEYHYQTSTVSRRRALLDEWPRDRLEELVSKSYKQDLLKLIPHRGDLEWLMDHYGLRFPEQRSVRVMKNMAEWIEAGYASLVEQLVSSKIPLCKIIRIASGEFPNSIVSRYMKTHHPHYHGNQLKSSQDSVDLVNFPLMAHKKFGRIVRSIPGTPLPVISALFDGASLESVKRFMKGSGINVEEYPECSSSMIWDWALRHKELVLSLFHTTGSLRNQIVARLSVYYDSELHNEVDEEIGSLNSASSILRRNWSPSMIFVLFHLLTECELSDTALNSFSRYLEKFQTLTPNDRSIINLALKWNASRPVRIPHEVERLGLDKEWIVYSFHKDMEFLNYAKTSLGFTDEYELSAFTSLISKSIIQGVYSTRSFHGLEWGKSRSRFSKSEDLVANVIERTGVEVQRNQRVLMEDGAPPKEVDLFIPSLGLGFEISPTHTHNSTYGWARKRSLAKPVSYHSHKNMLAEAQGINLITLYGHDLEEPTWSEKTIPFIQYLLNGPSIVLYARDTVIRKIPPSVSKEFLESTHFQGAVPASWHFGWFSKNGDLLLGVATLRKSKRGGVELARMAFLPDVQVRYGLSKMVKTIPELVPELNGIRLWSYSRNDMGVGQAYKSSGFKFEGNQPPSLKFVNPNDSNDYYSWQVGTPWSAKSGVISRIIGPSDMTKDEAIAFMEDRMPHRYDGGTGYLKVYDSGNKLWSIIL